MTVSPPASRPSKPAANVRLDISIEQILGLLNGTLNAAEVNAFWMGDSFFETNVRATHNELAEKIRRRQKTSHIRAVHVAARRFSEALVMERDAALRKLRACIDEWIDSGRRPDGTECVIERSEIRARSAVTEAEIFWRTSRFERSSALPLGSVKSWKDPETWMSPEDLQRHRAQMASFKDGSLVRILPPINESFDNPPWKVRRSIAALLDSDVRVRIAKCRYEKCSAPYFLLKKPKNKLYERGLFCSREHSNKVGARFHRAQTRHDKDAKYILLMAEFCLRQQISPENERIRRELARRRKVSLRYVTTHKDEILIKIEELRRGQKQQSKRKEQT